MKQYLAVAAAAVASVVAVPAGAATFVGNRVVGNGSVILSITTDNTIGALKQANILDWTVSLFQGTNKVTLTKSNAQLLLSNGAFNASAKDLSFDFAGTESLALFQTPTVGSGGHFYCIENLDAWCSGRGVGESIFATHSHADMTSAARTGNQVIASVAATGGVPEPATWGLMILGFGVVGGALRRRQSIATNVRFA